MSIWGITSSFPELSPSAGQVAYALRTRAPVAGIFPKEDPLPLDLHVLGLPLAFILSQDQTLRCKKSLIPDNVNSLSLGQRTSDS